MKISRKYSHVFRYIYIIAAVIIIAVAIPKKGRFIYEFERGKPWMHEDLFAPFLFAVEKSPETLERERAEVRQNFHPFYYRIPDASENAREKFQAALQRNLREQPEEIQEREEFYLNQGNNIIAQVYRTGIIRKAEEHQEKEPDARVRVMENRVAEDYTFSDFLTLEETTNQVRQRIQTDTALNRSFFIGALVPNIEPNIHYDRTLSENRLNELLNKISPTEGIVEENERIISKGDIVTQDRFQVLVSLRSEYEQRLGTGGENLGIFSGYLLILLLTFIIFITYIQLFDNAILKNNRSIILVLVNMLVFIFISIYVVDNPIISIYVVPYAIMPIILMAFFGSLTALLSHLLVILIVGIFVPNAYEFVLIQSVAGLTAIFAMLRIRYISQFFISTLLIFLVYLLSYFSISLIKGLNINEMEWTHFLWFGGNFILTLLAYPLIYAHEKAYGFVSDISLIELSDINRKLLRKLALKSPGSFQHSLQVSNISENIISELGGDALLTRVGALYHDIGKLENPAYFIENQKYLKNPHDYLDEEESARIIIKHVTKGVEIAKRNRLPNKIIDFIRTHHGTSRVEFFYQNYLKKNEGAENDDSMFRYPGPRPFSKETAVVMIVDSVEAASRSLKKIDDVTIDNLIDKIIDNKIEDGQLDDAAITLKELNIIRERLKQILKSLYHVRIEYPDQEKQQVPQV